MNDKYFVPQIEDFKIGYEFEFYDDDDRDWISTIVNSQSALCNWTGFDNIQKRVPYLTKEQIEAEGWKEIHDEEYIKDISTENDKPSQIWWFNNNGYTKYQSTFEFRYRGYNNVKFQGECKSINEFRYICKLLKIN